MIPFNENEVGDMVINPFSAVVLKDYLFFDHELEGAKEDWRIKNTQLMSEMGANDWLEQLLIALSTDPQDNPTYTIINPYKAIFFSERLQGVHVPIVTPEMWVEANTKLIEEYSADKWLWRLLEVLESGGSEN